MNESVYAVELQPDMIRNCFPKFDIPADGF